MLNYSNRRICDRYSTRSCCLPRKTSSQRVSARTRTSRNEQKLLSLLSKRAATSHSIHVLLNFSAFILFILLVNKLSRERDPTCKYSHAIHTIFLRFCVNFAAISSHHVYEGRVPVLDGTKCSLQRSVYFSEWFRSGNGVFCDRGVCAVIKSVSMNWRAIFRALEQNFLSTCLQIVNILLMCRRLHRIS